MTSNLCGATSLQVLGVQPAWEPAGWQRWVMLSSSAAVSRASSLKTAVQSAKLRLEVTTSPPRMYRWANRVKSKLGLVGVELDEAQLVEDEQVGPVDLGGQPREAVLGLGLGEVVDQLGHGHEAHPLALAAGGQAQRGGDMGFTGARRAHRKHHFAALDVGAAGQVQHQLGIERGDAAEVELGELVDLGKAHLGDAVALGIRVALVDLGFQQGGQELHRTEALSGE